MFFGLCKIGLLLAFSASRLLAQEAESPPPKPVPGVRITFLPPPMEGTLSLGIYNKAGKLVRVLKWEAVEKDFTVGLNGFITQWDGKDDAGNAAPAGKYLARGFTVGALEVEGVAYHCNDWITGDDSPRVAQISSLRALPGDALLARGVLAGGAPVALRIAADGKVDVTPTTEVPPGESSQADVLIGLWGKPLASKAGQIVLATEQPDAAALPDLHKPIASSPGRDGSIWVIDRSVGEEVKQYSAAGEFLRRLTIQPDEPRPRQIAASPSSDLIFLLETTLGTERVRGLALDVSAVAPAEGAPPSTWKTVFSKTIRASEDFASISDKLGRAQPFKPDEKLSLKLLPNPLYKETATTAELAIGFDAKGAFLRTHDGLPLARLTETPHLKWAVLGRDPAVKAITIFQGDGAVVEEFRTKRLANMMSFDAGEYEWSPGTK